MRYRLPYPPPFLGGKARSGIPDVTPYTPRQDPPMQSFCSLLQTPSAYVEALDFVRSALSKTADEDLFGYPTCKYEVVLAGGCLRDLVLGREPRDFDIFVLGWDKSDDEFAKVFGVDPGEAVESSGPVAAPRIVMKDRGYDIIAPHPVLIPDVRALLTSFDVGICRIAYSSGIWSVHSDFLTDLAASVIRVRGLGAHTVDSIHAHVERLRGYYPDFAVDTSLIDEPSKTIWSNIAEVLRG